MARNIEGIFTEVWAETGDKAQPIFPIEQGWDIQYSTPLTSGGLAPERETFNYLYNQLYALGVDINTMGASLEWDSTITYVKGATVIASDGITYESLDDNNIGVDPANKANPVDWTDITRYKELEDTTPGTEGSRRVGYNGVSVYDAIGARPTSTTLASNIGASLIGTASGETVQEELDSISQIPTLIAAGQTDGGSATLRYNYNAEVGGVTDNGARIFTLDFSIASSRAAGKIFIDSSSNSPTTGTNTSVSAGWTADCNYHDESGGKSRIMISNWDTDQRPGKVECSFRIFQIP